MTDRIQESLTRVKLMAECGQYKWDLSPNDQQALSDLLSQVEAAEKQVKMLEGLNASQAESIGSFISIVRAASDAGVTFSWEETPIGKRAIAHNEAAEKLAQALLDDLRTIQPLAWQDLHNYPYGNHGAVCQSIDACIEALAAYRKTTGE
jgi:hypothetical protein